MGPRLLSLPLLLLALTATTLQAQAKLAIYGTFGGEKTGVTNEGWTTAGTLGLYYGLAHVGPLAFSADARADLSTNANSGLFGPRLALHLPAFPLKPYAELLIGFSHYSNVSGAPRNTTGFAYRGIGGLDATILPHIDWRVIELSGGHIEDAANNSISLTTGLVLRF